METIIYQGQELSVQVVNYIHGDGITTSTAKEFSGEEELLRDEAGRYYLRQTVKWIDPKGSQRKEALVKGSRRPRVHRINLNAAILWAATRLNSTTDHLRADAADLLMDGRGYQDPAPTLPMRRAEVEAAALPEGSYMVSALALDAAIDDTITVPLTLPRDLYREVLAMGEYDGRAGLSKTVQESMEGDVQAWQESDNLARRRKRLLPTRFLKRWLREHPQTGTPPDEARLTVDLRGVRDERIMAILDAHVTGLLISYQSENPRENVRDTINGVLACLLECDLHDRSEHLSTMIEEARNRRVARDKAAQQKGGQQ